MTENIATPTRVRATPRARLAAVELGVDLVTLAVDDEALRLADVVAAAGRRAHRDRPAPEPAAQRQPPGVALLEVDCSAWWQPGVDVDRILTQAVDAALADFPLLRDRVAGVLPIHGIGDVGADPVALPSLAAGEVVALGRGPVGPRVAAVTLSDGSYAIRVGPQALLALVWDQSAIGSPEPMAFANRLKELAAVGSAEGAPTSSQ